MDADDISLSDRFALQIKFLQQHPDYVCVGGAYDLIDAKGANRAAPNHARN